MGHDSRISELRFPLVIDAVDFPNAVTLAPAQGINENRAIRSRRVLRQPALLRLRGDEGGV